MNTEKHLTKLMDEIKKQDFKSADEINNFLSNMMGGNLDDLPKRTDKKEQSQDLVFDAYEQPISKGKKLVKKALELDPNNADAYNYLASTEKDTDKAIKMYNTAIKISEKTLGKKLFKEEKGFFWGILETRPYMRSKLGLASCLFAKNEIDKAINIYKEMLTLNPQDNQGVRYLLSTLLVGKDDLTEFELFIEKNEDENCAIWNYNNALYKFKKLGKTTESDALLLKAHNNNQFVIDLMLGNKKMPNEQPQSIGRGDESEAVSYLFGAWLIWEKSDGAFDWLFAFKQKKMNIN
jgi:tetratricopeptide (TPR) repeat protein